MSGRLSERPGTAGAEPCPRGRDVLASLQGELSPRAEEDLRTHLAGCLRCQEEASEVEEVLRGLRTSRDAETPVDVLPAVLARVEAEHVPALDSHRKLRLAGAAAGVLLTLAALWVVFGKVPPPARETRLASRWAMEWLERAQEPSGGFSALRWGGRPEFDVGLTGLAAMALLSGDPGSSLARAIDYLVASQSPEGRFGPDVREGTYNHGIATVALLEAFAARREERLRRALEPALAYIRSSQCPEGGWGYLGGDPDGANTAATCWPLQALLMARSLGWSGLDEPIGKAFRHLSRVTDHRGRLGYRRAGESPGGEDALSSMGALCVLLARDETQIPSRLRSRILDEVGRASARVSPGEDLYRDFFIASVVEALPDSRRLRWRSDALQALGAAQVDVGPDRGSWEPRDTWAPAGGRVYATAFGALILEAGGRGRRLQEWQAGGS